MIVMKFGGTSVKDVEAVRRVVQVVGRERRPRLVVVSALSKVSPTPSSSWPVWPSRATGRRHARR